MGNLRAMRLGTAIGIASVLFYVGCMVLMFLLGESGTVIFFNSLMHGLDVKPILRMDVPLVEEAMGIVFIFVLGWLFGVLVAGTYNLLNGEES